MLRLKRKFSLVLFFSSALFLLWFLLLVVSPFAVPSGALRDLSGTVGVSDNVGLFSRLPLPWSQVYSIGDQMCHQRADRSFFLGGNEMAFCARCTGVWLGIVVGLLCITFFEVPLDFRLAWIFLLGLLPLAVDGGGQLLGLWESTNVVRLLTGLLAGVVGGLGIGVLLEEIRDVLLIRKEKNTG